jgi:hypothetical protein
MRWPFRYKRQPSDQEGIERAKTALAIARQIEVHADESARVHEDILRRNNLGVKVHRALGGN